VSRRLSWGVPEPPPPKRPYRDTVILYGALALVIVVVAWATGGSIGRALVFAAGFFVVATSWSFWRWRARLRQLEDARTRAEERPPD
jgi:hypothetical protein